MKKRLLTLILVLTLLISMCAAPSLVHAEETVGEYELGVMKALGIIDEDVSAGDTITRGDILHIMLKLVNQTSNDTAEEIYLDVPVTSPYAADVYAATQFGIISGAGDGNFYPDLLLNSADAVKMLVCVMGYEKKAEALGGYPTGYYTAALSFGMDTVSSNTLTMGQLSAMIYSILEEPVAEVSEIFTDGTISYTLGNTLLEQMDMKMYEGVFCANGSENIYGKTPAGEGRITVGNKDIVADKQYDELFGCYVNAYTRTDNRDRAYLLHMEAVDTELISAKYTDVTNSSSVLSDMMMKIQRENDSKIKDYKLESDVSILYNGVISDVYSNDIFETASGYVTLIDNNNNRKYDVVKIESGEDIVSGGYSAISEIVLSKYGSGINISSENILDGFKITDVSGAEIAPETIMEWDVVSAYYNKPRGYSDRKLTSVKVMNTSFNGKIEYVGIDYIGIDGVEYKLSPGFVYGGELINIDNGMSATFFLNSCGEVFAAKADMLSDINKKTGILIGFDTDNGLNKSVTVKVYDHIDEMKTAEIADKVELDGDRITKEDCYASLAPRGKVSRQLIRYTLNSDGKINYIDTANQGSNESDTTLEIIHTIEDESVKYFSGSGSFAGIYNIDNNTKRFSQPKEITDDESYISAVSLKDDAPYSLDVYITDNPFVAFAIVLNDAGSSNMRESDLFLVTKVSTVLDENGEEVYKLSALGQSNTTDYYMEESVYNKSKVEAGDIVCFAVKNTTKISDIQIIYDLSEDRFFSDTNPYGLFAANQRVMMCSAYEKRGSWVSLAFDDPANVVNERTLESRNVDKFRKYVWDIDEEKGRAATADDIVDYKSASDACTKIFISESSSWPKMCIMYN